MMRPSFLFPALGLLLSACFQANFEPPTRIQDGSIDDEDETAGDGDLADPDTTADGSMADADGPTDDAEAPGPQDDAGPGDAETDAETVAPPQHASCQGPAPAAMPAQPTFAEDTEDAFGAWKELPCDDLEVEMFTDSFNACDDSAPCLSYGDACVKPEAGKPGFCISWFDERPGELPWLLSDNGSCSVGLSPAGKRAACCLGLVDCETKLKSPGEDCLKHEDCEPGLVCAGEPDWLYGICVCPGVDPSGLTFNQCAKEWSPMRWGAIPDALGEGACLDGASPGWVEEVVAAGRFESLSAATHDGSLYVLTAGPSSMDGTFLHTRETDGSWTHATLDERHSSDVAIAFSTGGAMHVAACMGSKLFAGIGSFGKTLIDDGCAMLDLVLDSHDNPNIAYNNEFNITAKFTRGSGPNTWLPSLTIGTEGTNLFPPALAIDDEDRAHVWYGGNQYAVVVGDEVDSNEEAVAYAEQADVTDHGAAPLVAYTDSSDPSHPLYVLPLSDTSGVPEIAWVQDQPGYRDENIEPRIVFAKDGEPVIAHRTPTGIALTKRSDGEWSTERVVAVASQPADNLWLLFDADDQPHVFYSVDTNFTLDQELRHAYRGSCPTAK